MTTDYVASVFDALSEIERYWLCLPVGASCAVNMDGPTARS